MEGTTTVRDERAVGDVRTATGGGHRAAALAVVAASYGLAVASLVIAAVNRTPWSQDQWFFVVDLTDALVYAPVGYLLLTRSGHAVSWLVSLTAVGGGLAALGFQWSQYHVAHPDSPTLVVLSSAQQWGWVPGTLALFLVIPYLLQEGPPSRPGRVGVALGSIAIAQFTFVRLTDPYPWPDAEPASALPIRSEGWANISERILTTQIVVLVVLGLAATAYVVARWARLGPEHRRGLGWFAIGSFLVTVSFVPLALPPWLVQDLPMAFTPLLHLGSQLFFPAGILVVVLGQRLWGVDLAVSRAVSWGLLTAMLTAAYVVVVAALATLVPGEPGLRQVIATAFVAAGFQPVKTWVQARVDHLVHGEAAEPLRVVRSLGQGVGNAVAPEQLLDDVVHGVRSSLRLGRVAIVATTDGHRTVLASTDDDRLAGTLEGAGGADATGERSLAIQGQAPCTLVVAPRQGERLDARTERSLEELTPIIAAAVQLTATAAELSRSRVRLSEARDEERRRLRRELHDGLGPALAGIGLALQASRNLLATDPDTAGELLGEMVTEIDRRVEGVRAMARDLLPPTLEGEGLVPALLELAELHRAHGIAMEVQVGARAEVSDANATAAYAIASEAVRNVVRHATATRCSIELLDLEPDQFALVVTDDGCGIRDDARPGVGLTSMREWAEGVGGTIELSPAEPNGTRITARIPVGAP